MYAHSRVFPLAFGQSGSAHTRPARNTCFRTRLNAGTARAFPAGCSRFPFFACVFFLRGIFPPLFMAKCSERSFHTHSSLVMAVSNDALLYFLDWIIANHARPRDCSFIRGTPERRHLGAKLLGKGNGRRVAVLLFDLTATCNYDSVVCSLSPSPLHLRFLISFNPFRAWVNRDSSFFTWISELGEYSFN